MIADRNDCIILLPHDRMIAESISKYLIIS